MNIDVRWQTAFTDEREKENILEQIKSAIEDQRKCSCVPFWARVDSKDPLNVHFFAEISCACKATRIGLTGSTNPGLPVP